ncbi:MAG: tetratricopeptide repeat protein [Desulfobacteraceae bacterium]|jgi:cytochrome c-type biogenesis protein CcmH/NrfG
MAESKKQPGYMKNENALMIAFITLTIGFLGGVFFGVYKTSSAVVPQSGGQMPPVEDRTADIEALKKLTRENPEDADSWIKLGHLYFDTNQIDEAINAYETSLKYSSDNANVLTDLGVMYRRSGNPEKAVEKFDQAIASDPSHEIARFNKGIVLMHDLNDAKGATAVWRELLERNPNAKTPNGQLIKDLISQFNKPNS